MKTDLAGLRAALEAIDAALAKLRGQAAEGGDLAQLADDVTRARTQRELLAERIKSAAEAERQAEAAKAARAAERERQAVEEEIRGRRDALEGRWAQWGRQMTALDESLPAAWEEYRSMARAALDLDHDAKARNVLLAPIDTTPAAGVLARILSGESGIKDRRK